MGSMGFPITIICTLQGTSVTQGNATVFTGNKFAVYCSHSSSLELKGALKWGTVRISISIGIETKKGQTWI